MTYGFPVDMTAEMLVDEGMTLNMDEFKALMEEQRVRAREARKKLSATSAGRALTLALTQLRRSLRAMISSPIPRLFLLS